MTIEELKAMLEGSDKAEQIIEAVVDMVNSEKNKGIDATRKKDKENLRIKSVLKELGFDPDEDGDLETFVQKTKKIKSEVDTTKLTNAQLAEKLADLESKINEERTRASVAEKKAIREKISSALTSALSDKVYGFEYIIKSLMADNAVSVVDDSVVFVNGDDVVPFEKGIEDILEKNSGMRKMAPKAGSGSSKNDTKGDGELDLSSMSKEEVLRNISKVREQLGLRKR